VRIANPHFIQFFCFFSLLCKSKYIYNLLIAVYIVVCANVIVAFRWRRLERVLPIKRADCKS